MKPLLPSFCRILGYVIIAGALFLPFILAMTGHVNNNNLIFLKECTKLLMMVGAIMILFAITKGENSETERIRTNAMRNAMVITLFYIFGNMVLRVYWGDTTSVDTSSFLTFLIINVLCLEFGVNKARIDKVFKR